MITKIIMKNVASYDADGVEIGTLKKVNFIYGANATGKTTLSNYLQNPASETYSNCAIEWDSEYHQSCYVYNKSFRESNFGLEEIPGVFTLGHENKEVQEKIRENNFRLTEIVNQGKKLKEDIEKKRATKDRFFKEFQETVWDSIFKKYQNVFADAFVGFKGSKRDFTKKICAEFENNKNAVKNIDELKQLAKTIFGQNPQPIDSLNVSIPNVENIENDSIWKKVIVGNKDVDIAKLIDRLDISNWVAQGRNLIEEQSDVCPFCQKHTIDEDFRKQLEKFFDEEFTCDVDSLNKLKSDYENILFAFINNCRSILNIKFPIELLDTNQLNFAISNLFNTVKDNIGQMEQKIAKPNCDIIIVRTTEAINTLKSIIVESNEKIRVHNNVVVNIKDQKKQLIGDIWKYLVEENAGVINAHIKRDRGLEQELTRLQSQVINLQNQYQSLRQEIQVLNKSITSIQPTIDEINKVLSSYGFDSFRIEPTDVGKNTYRIVRPNGTNATKTLSEGEVTFISFLYFLQLTKGALNPTEASSRRIVIVDDPISSLDSSILFVVSSLLKEIISGIKKGDGNIEQIIVLTHNVYFHKEVSFVNGRSTDKAQNTPYYGILRKNGMSTTIKTYKENPIQNSYELLWDELRDKDHLSLITIQNTLRRILETYFKILGGLDDDNILDKFENPQEKEICRSFLCWINDGSHCIPDDLYIEQSDIQIDKYLSVFEKIFTETGHEAHYKMMMRL